MNEKTKMIIEEYAASQTQTAETLLMELGKIPAPSHREDKRAVFCRDWLLSQGAEDVTIDAAKNVVCKIGVKKDTNLIVFMAHMDIVFPDLEPLTMKQEGRRLYAPGIGDDTANLVNLLMAAKFLLQNKPKMNTGFLIVANACEEGLGNLDGCKEIFRTYGSQIRAFYSFDGSLSNCTCEAVGSYRYKITVKTAGGHSWSDFGTPNAIEILCRLVERLYRVQVPTEARTTYNVGYIQGGTTVNSIAQEASVLYEFRSTSQKCLKIMQQNFDDILEDMIGAFTIETELMGVRPGNGDISAEALKAFTEKNAEIIQMFCPGEIDYNAASTDSNIPLSLGISANTIGTIAGKNAHTREEWVDLDSIPTGMKIALGLMLQYTEL